jgi:hypothetical protein
VSTPTPGPWTNDDGLVYGKDSRARFRGRPSNDIFNANEWSAELTDEAMANARLVSAAPDMLAALKNALALWGGQCTDEPQRAWLEQTREAIRKATEP